MARVLIVGCGRRGQALAQTFVADGIAVRGTTRDPAKLPAIEATGVQGVVADPDRVGTISQQFAGVTVLCLLLGSAIGSQQELEELHGNRLWAILEKVVDSPVRSVVYEAAGSVDPALLAGGCELLGRARDTWTIPVATIDVDPATAGPDPWVLAAREAILHLL